MARSLWKGPYFEYSFTKIEGFRADRLLPQGSLNTLELSSKRNQLKGIQKIWSRRSVILPQFVDQIFQIHNGKQFIKLQVVEEMIGHKFGEFALTRKKPRHVVPKKNKPTK